MSVPSLGNKHRIAERIWIRHPRHSLNISNRGETGTYILAYTIFLSTHSFIQYNHGMRGRGSVYEGEIGHGV